MPATVGSKAIKYKLALAATGTGGSAKAKVTVVVGPASKSPGTWRVGAGEAHTCVLLSSGHIQCWGENHYGELGDGSTTNTDTPVEVQGI
ncbi:MAG TPA: RCC1 domain-containing protein, partial [Solirubrobacteraceae bacterium]|nr:RCC1 domain-containing protein [Solirubrobacteraceae bacterium]